MNIKRPLIFIIIILMLTSPAIGQTRYFYKGYNYGSQALFNPVNLVLNGGYGILQDDGHSHDIVHYPYRAGAHNVWRNLSDPFNVISRYGVRDFFSHEIFPLSLTKSGAQWLPNYKLHLIGGGMTYRALYEWYDYYHFPHPRIISITTLGAYHYLNEVVEDGGYIGDNADPIADIYVFDVAGVILFSFDNINRFFGETLNLSDWSLMPSFDLQKFTIQDQGQNFSIRWKTPLSEKFRFMYYFGNLGLSGVSYSLTDSTSFTIAAGARTKKRYIVDESTHRETVSLAWNCGIFYDRNNSLMASLFVSDIGDKMIFGNLYPGIFKIGNFSPGFWFITNRKGYTMGGIMTTWLPGIAIR